MEHSPAINIKKLQFSLSTNAKEAIKTAAAFVIAYWIALSSNWLNPSWAGFAVIMVSLPTAGQSIRKGLLRCYGTIPGCIAAIVVVALAPQQPWLFIFLLCCWIFFTTYMMIVDKERTYFWNVAGFVCLIIVLAGPSGVEGFFQHAIMRTIETLMGVIVYILISILVWPQSNAGAVRKTFSDLIATQTHIIQCCHNVMQHKEVDSSFNELLGQSASKIGAFANASEAESVENIGLFNNRLLLKELKNQTTELNVVLMNWSLTLSSMGEVDFEIVLPAQRGIFEQHEEILDAIQQSVTSDIAIRDFPQIAIEFDKQQLAKLSHYDLAALQIVQAELNRLDSILRALLKTVNLIKSNKLQSEITAELSKSKASTPSFLGTMTPNIDALKMALFPPLVAFVGFVVWVYFDPPGHAAMIQFPATLAMVLATMPQIRLTSILIVFAITLPLCLGVYVFVLPQLTLFIELAAVYFVCIFLVCYYIQGLARLIGLIAIINMIAIQNQQTYDFAVMASSLLFTLMAVAVAFVMSYAISSPRPEKAMLALIRRFFRSASWLLYHEQHHKMGIESLSFRLKYWFHTNQVMKIPNTILPWARSIDKTLFDRNSAEQTDDMVSRIQILSHRLRQLIEGNDTYPIEFTDKNVDSVTQSWQKFLGGLLYDFSTLSSENVSQLMDGFDQEFEQDIAATMIPATESISEKQALNLLVLISVYRGIFEASRTYAELCQDLDWSDWQEERFT